MKRKLNYLILIFLLNLFLLGWIYNSNNKKEQKCLCVKQTYLQMNDNKFKNIKSEEIYIHCIDSIQVTSSIDNWGNITRTKIHCYKNQN